MIKLIACDMDGTLLDSQKASAARIARSHCAAQRKGRDLLRRQRQAIRLAAPRL